MGYLDSKEYIWTIRSHHKQKQKPPKSSKWIIYLNIKAKNIKLRIQHMLSVYDLGLSDDLLDVTPKCQIKK